MLGVWIYPPVHSMYIQYYLEYHLEIQMYNYGTLTYGFYLVLHLDFILRLDWVVWCTPPSDTVDPNTQEQK